MRIEIIDEEGRVVAADEMTRDIQHWEMMPGGFVNLAPIHVKVLRSFPPSTRSLGLRFMHNDTEVIGGDCDVSNGGTKGDVIQFGPRDLLLAFEGGQSTPTVSRATASPTGPKLSPRPAPGRERP